MIYCLLKRGKKKTKRFCNIENDAEYEEDMDMNIKWLDDPIGNIFNNSDLED